MKLTARDPLGRIAFRIAVYEEALKQPPQDGRCRYCGTYAACTCLSDLKQNLAYADKRLAALRGMFSPEEVEKVLGDSKWNVESLESDD